MKKALIEQLYQGELSPADNKCLKNPKLHEKMDISAEIEERLMETLEGESWRLFTLYCEVVTDINIMTSQERFTDGFCMGMRLAIETLSDNE